MKYLEKIIVKFQLFFSVFSRNAMNYVMINFLLVLCRYVSLNMVGSYKNNLSQPTFFNLCSNVNVNGYSTITGGGKIWFLKGLFTLSKITVGETSQIGNTKLRFNLQYLIDL